MRKAAAVFTMLLLLICFAAYAAASAGDPVWSPDGTKIAYTCSYGGDANIWIADADGSNPIQLTHHPHIDWDPDWSPDGSKIVFSHDRDGDQAIFNIWTINVDGSNLAQLTFSNSGWESAAVWSPDGSKIAFDGITMMNADGTNQQFITAGALPSFSGDGARIVYTNDNDIWAADPDGGNAVRLTSDPALDWHPDFSRDGLKIVFTSDRDGGSAIWTIDAEGSNLSRIADAGFTGEPQWSPDGTKIMYEGPDGNIWVINADGSAPTLIPTLPYTTTISGKITDNNGTPIEGVNVNAYSGQCHNGHLGAGTTDASGNYVIGGIPEDSQAYIWADSTPTDRNFTLEWYDEGDGSSDCGFARPVDAGASGVDIVLEAAGSITGTVRDAAGQPLSNLFVGAIVYVETCNGPWLAGAHTNADGVYRIDHVPPGPVIIRTGSEDGLNSYVNEYWDDAYNCSEAGVITVTAGNTVSGYDFQLAPGGSVSGHVVDADTHQPLVNVHVYAQAEACGGAVAGRRQYG